MAVSTQRSTQSPSSRPQAQAVYLAAPWSSQELVQRVERELSWTGDITATTFVALNGHIETLPEHELERLLRVLPTAAPALAHAA